MLLDRADPADVVLLSRNPDGLAAFAERGADVRRGDFGDPAGLAAALDGVDRLLLISTDIIDGRAEKQAAAVLAAVQAGVGHLLYTSIPRPDPSNPAGVVPSQRRHRGRDPGQRRDLDDPAQQPLRGVPDPRRGGRRADGPSS